MTIKQDKYHYYFCKEDDNGAVGTIQEIVEKWLVPEGGKLIFDTFPHSVRTNEYGNNYPTEARTSFTIKRDDNDCFNIENEFTNCFFNFEFQFKHSSDEILQMFLKIAQVRGDIIVRSIDEDIAYIEHSFKLFCNHICNDKKEMELVGDLYDDYFHIKYSKMLQQAKEAAKNNDIELVAKISANFKQIKLK